jgi:cytochrome b
MALLHGLQARETIRLRLVQGIIAHSISARFPAWHKKPDQQDGIDEQSPRGGSA